MSVGDLLTSGKQSISVWDLDVLGTATFVNPIVTDTETINHLIVNETTVLNGTLQFTTAPALGYILTSDSAGNASWEEPGIGPPPGSNILVENASPAVTINDNALNTNNATLSLSGRYPSVSPLTLTQDASGNGVLTTGAAAGNITIQAGSSTGNVALLPGTTGATLAANLTSTGTTTLSGNTNVSGTLTAGELAVSGDSVLSGYLDVEGAARLETTLDVTGATTLDTTLGVAGASTLSGGFSSGASSSVTGAFTVTGTETVTGTAPTLTISGPTATLFVTAVTPNVPSLVLTETGFSPAVIYQDTAGNMTLQNENKGSNIAILASGSGNINLQTNAAGNINFNAVSGAVYINSFPVVFSTRGAVTQTGIASSPVTYNGTSCNITTVTLTNPPAFTVQFVWNNTFITGSSIVLVSVSNDASLVNGFPLVYTDAPSLGSTTIVIQNVSTSTAFSGTLTISCLVC
jgi:hypothetical protein